MVPWSNGLNCCSFAAKCDTSGGRGAVSCVPGARAGVSVTAATDGMESLYRACVADGFEDVSGAMIGSDYKLKNLPNCDKAHHLLAVFYDNRHSFHFARQLADGGQNRQQCVHRASAAQDADNMQNDWYLGEDILLTALLRKGARTGLCRARPSSGRSAQRAGPKKVEIADPRPLVAVLPPPPEASIGRHRREK